MVFDRKWICMVLRANLPCRPNRRECQRLAVSLSLTSKWERGGWRGRVAEQEPRWPLNKNRRMGGGHTGP